MRYRVLSLVGLCLLAAPARPDGPADLPASVAALLRQRCVTCHDDKARKGGLDLTSSQSLSRGSKNGPVVVPGKLESSRLWELVSGGRMPPKEPLAEAERNILRQWIADGARGVDPKAASTHWAFRVPVRPPLPELPPHETVGTPVDAFLLARLAQRQLTFSPPADRAMLIRRVSFDLTGLPPTPAEIEAFVNDPAPNAYAAMVERYLASPHYGERWGKYWLDVAGYADSNGYFNADSNRPLAWKYRDYVLRSFNADKPYDRLVLEQLAGDELVGFKPEGDLLPPMVEALTATHFLRNAPDGSGESDGNPDEVLIDRFTVLEGTLQITMNSLLGIGIQCARCHDHKFEPITQAEYYRLQAIFFPAYCPDRWTKPNDRTVSIGTRAQREDHQRRMERIDRQVKTLQAGLANVVATLREPLLEERLQKLEPALRERVLQAAALPKEKLSKEQQELLKEHVAPLKLGEDEVAARYPEIAALRDQTQKTIAEREKERPKPLDKLSVLIETDPKPPTHHILVRGRHNSPGAEVQPGVPAALQATERWRIEQPTGQISSGRRTALARWITAPENPLFARVMVNRIWQRHFGTGLVVTPDNFGQSGAPPSHPELLDWLAVEFKENGYSIKQLHRQILLSRAYRQASAPRSEGLTADPDNQLLWRFPLRRLDAEALRDALLAISGELDHHFGGPYVPTRRTGEGAVEVDESRPDARRRSVYLQQRRTQVTTLLELFDAPSITVNCSVRHTSTVPLQALTLMNSEFARRRADRFARRLETEVGADPGQRVAQAFRLAAGRVPDPAEQAAVNRFLETQRAVYQAEKDAEQRVWTDLCQMILSSNAFLYVE